MKLKLKSTNRMLPYDSINASLWAFTDWLTFVTAAIYHNCHLLFHIFFEVDEMDEGVYNTFGAWRQ